MARRKRLVKIDSSVGLSVWWSDADTLDAIEAHGDLFAVRYGRRWYTHTNQRWHDAGFCAGRLDALPLWPDEAPWPEDLVDPTVTYRRYSWPEDLVEETEVEAA